MSTPAGTARPVTMRSTKADIFAALQDQQAGRRHRPLTHMDLARLLACDGVIELAGWVLGREVNYACVNRGRRAADLGAAMKLYISARKVLDASEAGS